MIPVISIPKSGGSFKRVNNEPSISPSKKIRARLVNIKISCAEIKKADYFCDIKSQKSSA